MFSNGIFADFETRLDAQYVESLGALTTTVQYSMAKAALFPPSTDADLV